MDGNDGREYDIPLTGKGASDWAAHPDPTIDVAIVPINTVFLREQGIQFKYFASDTSTLNCSQMASNGLTEGDFIYVLGFPMGLVGYNRNAVIVRSGSIARIRDSLTGIDAAFLIDAAVFPGNSGGPVISRPEVFALPGTKAQSKSNLIGIVQAYLPYEDVAISQQTGEPRFVMHENSGLGVVHPVDYIEETIHDFLQKYPERAAIRSGAATQT